MKNPFLQDRNIFSKVQKPIPKSNKQDNPTQNTNDKKNQYTPKYNIKPQNKLSTPIPSQSLGYTSYQKDNNTFTSTTGYQKQNNTFTSTQPINPPNKYLSSEKITFGDPLSSQNYNGDRTSGYFNMNTQQASNKASIQNQYQNLKYEPKKNNFIENENKNYIKESFGPDLNMKQTMKQFGKGYGNYKKPQQNKLQYQFAPPPINNFTTTQPISNKYSYQTNKFEYKSSLGGINQQVGSFKLQSNPFTGTKNSLTRQNPYTQNNNYSNTNNIYQSPPKQTIIPITPKNDISARFKQNNYGQFSPIGQVSKHKITQDSIMNLDGLMEGLQLDKLLAQSKTQQELLKILGMDASMIKKSPDSGNKNKPSQPTRSNPYNNKPQTNFYNQQNQYHQQNQYQFTKKTYQPQKTIQNNSNYQAFKYDDQQPEVFNYEQSYSKNTIKQKNINPFKRFSPQKNLQYSKPQPKGYKPFEQNFFQKPQIYQSRTNNNYINNQNNQADQQFDIQKMMQRQMQKFMYQQQGIGSDKRVFMTANQKIITKKYKLQPL